MASKNLIFVGQLKSYQNESASYTTQDSNFLLAIQATSDLFERICNREFFKKARTEKYNSVKNYGEYYDFVGNTQTSHYSNSGSYYLTDVYTVQLKHFPIDSTQPFELYYSDTGNFTSTNLVDPQYYDIDYTTGVLTIKFATNRTKKSLKITYTGGYTDSVYEGVVEDLNNPSQERSLGYSIPSDLKLAALIQASYYSAHIQASLCSSDNNNTVFLAGKNFMETYQLNPSAMLLLEKYKVKYINMV